jgi:hypothetical protein
MAGRASTLAALVLALGVTGCVYSHAGPGLLYMDVKGPLGKADGTPGGKTGEACANNILGIVAAGDATIDSAKKNGGVGEAKTVEYHSKNIIGFGTFCTVVDD